MVQMANSLTAGYFGTIMAGCIFAITLIYLATSERPFGYAFAVSSYITAILVIIMRVLSIVPDWVVFMSIVMAIGGVAYTVFSSKE